MVLDLFQFPGNSEAGKSGANDQGIYFHYFYV